MEHSLFSTCRNLSGELTKYEAIRQRADGKRVAFPSRSLQRLEVSVRLFVLRALGISVLVGLYELHPVIGVAALASGFGYILRQRTRRVDV